MAIDFNKLLSQEDRDRLECHAIEVIQLREADAEALLADVVHVYHNSGPPRYGDGKRMLLGESVYDAALYYEFVPELIRRMAGGVCPEKCPLCGQHVDWSVPSVVQSEALTEEESGLLRRCEVEGRVELKLLREWKASRRLVGRGLVERVGRDAAGFSSTIVKKHGVK